jgi:hypothetical protein
MVNLVNIPPIKMVMTGGLFMALFYPHYRLLTSINWDMTPTTMFFWPTIVSGTAPQVVRCFHCRKSLVNPGGPNITKTGNGIFTGCIYIYRWKDEFPSIRFLIFLLIIRMVPNLATWIGCSSFGGYWRLQDVFSETISLKCIWRVQRFGDMDVESRGIWPTNVTQCESVWNISWY